MTRVSPVQFRSAPPSNFYLDPTVIRKKRPSIPTRGDRKMSFKISKIFGGSRFE